MPIRLPLLVIFFGITFLFFSVGVHFLYNSALQNLGTIPLPDEIADHTLYFQQSGLHAREEFNRLHHKDFPLVAGAIGTYRHNQEVKLWVGETFLEFMAGKMILDMQEKIVIRTSPFKPTGELLKYGHTIYLLNGLGQRHFYFQTGKWIIWLAVDEDKAEEALLDVLEYYP